MSTSSPQARRAAEGHSVDITLRDGRRMDGCELVSGGGRRVPTLWLVVDGRDVFVSAADVALLEESGGAGPVAA